MPQNEMIEVTNSSGDKLRIEVSWESDVFEWVRVFKVILKWLEFADVTIEKALPKEDSLSVEE